MTPAYRWGWAYVPHFVHRPFYCYSYIFGYMLSVFLLERYRSAGRGVVEEMFTLLRTGSSRSPMEIVTEIGWDPKKTRSWEEGFRSIRSWVDAFGQMAG
jgi:oligoendopeptidase F